MPALGLALGLTNVSGAEALSAPSWPTGAVITSDGNLEAPSTADTLTADGTACVGNPAPDLTFQWQFDNMGVWQNQPGETAATLALGALGGLALRCVITGTNSEGSADSNSNASGVVS